MEEISGKDSPSLQIDPKCIKDALRTFLPPIKNEDPRLDFYTVYKKEATEYDVDYIKKYDEDLNTTLIFAGLFSAVSSAFVIDVQSKLEPDPNAQSAALLRAILLTLNQSAIPNETPVVPPVQEIPPNEIITVTGLMYASLLISLLAAFVAMLGKQWLNRYLRHVGGSMIERCGDRQRKCDGLEKWPFHLFIESLPVMLQASLLLLACGLCRHMWSINVSVAYILIILTILGVLFYFGIIIAGTSSYECPFQAPGSSALRRVWKKIQPRATLLAHPIVATSAYAYGVLLSHVPYPAWKKVALPIINLALRFKQAAVQVALSVYQGIDNMFVAYRRRFHHPSPVVPLEGVQQDVRVPPDSNPSPPDNNPSLREADSPTRDAYPPNHNTNSLCTPGDTGPWVTPESLTAIRKTNSKDVRCVSWILRSITDPEALDAAIRFASTIRWFEDGSDVEPPYHVILSTFYTCLDSTGAVYPGLSDRAYHSARTMLWVQIRAMSKSEGFANKFPLPEVRDHTSHDWDLRHLLGMYEILQSPAASFSPKILHGHATRTHMQWASQALLHFYWTKQDPEAYLVFFFPSTSDVHLDAIPLDAILNLLLVWSMFLGTHVEEEVLKVQDKTVCMERVMAKFSHAIITAILPSHLHHTLLPGLLLELVKWDARPYHLRTAAYEWCSAICEEHPNLEDAKEILFCSLEVGSRGLDLELLGEDAGRVLTKHHQRIFDIVFKYGDDEVIGDFLYAWTSSDPSRIPDESRNTCARYLVGLDMTSASQRLRKLVTRSVEFAGGRKCEQAGVEDFIVLLDNLDVGIHDMRSPAEWLQILIHLVRSPDGRRSLPRRYLELMVELAILGFQPWDPINEPPIMPPFKEEREWDVLEYWMGFTWVAVHPTIDEIPEGLERVTLSLFRQRPEAVQKFEQWLQRSYFPSSRIECLRWICDRAGLGAALQQDRPSKSISSVSMETGEPAHPSPSTLPLSVGDDTY